MRSCSYILVLFLPISVILIGLCCVNAYAQAQLADTMVCADETCSETISEGEARLAYRPRDDKFLNLKKGDVVLVKSKNAGKKTHLWGGQVMGSYRFGFFPSSFIKEYMVLVKSPKVSVSIQDFLKERSGPPVEDAYSGLVGENQKITIDKSRKGKGESKTSKKNEEYQEEREVHQTSHETPESKDNQEQPTSREASPEQQEKNAEEVLSSPEQSEENAEVSENEKQVPVTTEEQEQSRQKRSLNDVANQHSGLEKQRLSKEEERVEREDKKEQPEDGNYDKEPNEATLNEHTDGRNHKFEGKDSEVHRGINKDHRNNPEIEGGVGKSVEELKKEKEVDAHNEVNARVDTSKNVKKEAKLPPDIATLLGDGGSQYVSTSSEHQKYSNEEKRIRGKEYGANDVESLENEPDSLEDDRDSTSQEEIHQGESTQSERIRGEAAEDEPTHDGNSDGNWNGNSDRPVTEQHEKEHKIEHTSTPKDPGITKDDDGTINDNSRKADDQINRNDAESEDQESGISEEEIDDFKEDEDDDDEFEEDDDIEEDGFEDYPATTDTSVQQDPQVDRIEESDEESYQKESHDDKQSTGDHIQSHDVQDSADSDEVSSREVEGRSEKDDRMQVKVDMKKEPESVDMKREDTDSSQAGPTSDVKIQERADGRTTLHERHPENADGNGVGGSETSERRNEGKEESHLEVEGLEGSESQPKGAIEPNGGVESQEPAEHVTPHEGRLDHDNGDGAEDSGAERRIEDKQKAHSEVGGSRSSPATQQEGHPQNAYDNEPKENERTGRRIEDEGEVEGSHIDPANNKEKKENFDEVHGYLRSAHPADGSAEEDKKPESSIQMERKTMDPKMEAAEGHHSKPDDEVQDPSSKSPPDPEQKKENQGDGNVFEKVDDAINFLTKQERFDEEPFEVKESVLHDHQETKRKGDVDDHDKEKDNSDTGNENQDPLPESPPPEQQRVIVDERKDDVVDEDPLLVAGNENSTNVEAEVSDAHKEQDIDQIEADEGGKQSVGHSKVNENDDNIVPKLQEEKDASDPEGDVNDDKPGVDSRTTTEQDIDQVQSDAGDKQSEGSLKVNEGHEEEAADFQEEGKTTDSGSDVKDVAPEDDSSTTTSQDSHSGGNQSEEHLKVNEGDEEEIPESYEEEKTTDPGSDVKDVSPEVDSSTNTIAAQEPLPDGNQTEDHLNMNEMVVKEDGDKVENIPESSDNANVVPDVEDKIADTDDGGQEKIGRGEQKHYNPEEETGRGSHEEEVNEDTVLQLDNKEAKVSVSEQISDKDESDTEKYNALHEGKVVSWDETLEEKLEKKESVGWDEAIGGSTDNENDSSITTPPTAESVISVEKEPVDGFGSDAGVIDKAEEPTPNDMEEKTTTVTPEEVHQPQKQEAELNATHMQPNNETLIEKMPDDNTTQQDTTGKIDLVNVTIHDDLHEEIRVPTEKAEQSLEDKEDTLDNEAPEDEMHVESSWLRLLIVLSDVPYDILYILEPLFDVWVSLLPEEYQKDVHGVSWTIVLSTFLIGFSIIWLLICRSRVVTRRRKNELTMHTIQELKAQLESLSQEKIEVENELRTKHNETEIQRDLMASAAQEKETVTTEKRKLEHSLRQYNSENEALKIEKRLLNQSLQEKDQTIQEVLSNSQQVEKSLLAQQEVIARYETEIGQLRGSIETFQKNKKDADSSTEKLKERMKNLEKAKGETKKEGKVLKEQIEKLNATIGNLQEKLDAEIDDGEQKKQEIDVLKDCILQFKGVQEYLTGEGEDAEDEETIEKQKEKMKSMIDVANVKSTLRQSEADKLQVTFELEAERKSRLDSEAKISELEATLQSDLAVKNQMERDKQMLESKLIVMQDFYAKREVEIQSKLGLEQSKRESNAFMLEDKQKHQIELLQQLDAYKKMCEEAKHKYDDSDRQHKQEILGFEKKAHENWLACRDAERKFDEANKQIAQLQLELGDMRQRFRGAEREPILRPRPERHGPPGAPPLYGPPRRPPPPGIPGSPLHFRNGPPPDMDRRSPPPLHRRPPSPGGSIPGDRPPSRPDRPPSTHSLPPGDRRPPGPGQPYPTGRDPRQFRDGMPPVRPPLRELPPHGRPPPGPRMGGPMSSSPYMERPSIPPSRSPGPRSQNYPQSSLHATPPQTTGDGLRNDGYKGPPPPSNPSEPPPPLDAGRGRDASNPFRRARP